MKILDLSAGNRMIWHNRKHPLATYVDIRPEVKPDFVCDTRNLPPEVGSGFDLIVFDPPHMNLGKKSRMAKSYGHHTTAEILDTVKKTSVEAHRVSKPGALMALKWNDHDIKLERVLDLLPEWEPLFGHGLSIPGRRRSQTYWMLLRRLA